MILSVLPAKPIHWSMEVLFFWVGIAFVGIGTLILRFQLFPQYSTLDRLGKVVGYSAGNQSALKSSMFYTVVQFKNIDGQDYLTESSVGSNVPLHDPGQIVTVQINTNNPRQAHIKSSALLWLGFFILLMGLVSVIVFFSVFQWNFFSVAIAAIVSLGLLAKIFGFLEKNSEGFQQQHLQKYKNQFLKSLKPECRPLDEACQIHWCTPESLKKSMTEAAKAQIIAKPILVLICIAAFSGSYSLWKKTNSFLQQSIPAQGQIIDLKAKTDHGVTLYTPIVEYTHIDGKKYSFRHGTSSTHPSYKVGDTVSVLYIKENPTHAQIDGGPLWNYLSSLLTGGLGILLGLAAVFSKTKSFDTYVLPSYVMDPLRKSS